jgi:DNA-binding NarL/FixJ family response regulator
MSIRVLLVDDHALVRTGFRMVLDGERGIEVVGEAGDGHQAIHSAARLAPDVVLMDVRMPGLDGIAATRAIVAAGGGGDGAGGDNADPGAGARAAAPKVLILTTFDLDEYVFDSLTAGASGFLLKDVPPEQLVAGIRSVAAGDALLAPAVTRRLIDEFVRAGRRRPPGPPPGLGELTPRELEVLQLVAQGLSNAEISAALVVEETTVKTHVSRLLAKLGLRDRVQAVVLAYESGLAGGGAVRR